MFGLWFSIIGLIFGSLCSFLAKDKNRAQKEWFTLGFIFSVFALVLIYLLSDVENENTSGSHRISDTDNLSSLSVNV